MNPRRTSTFRRLRRVVLARDEDCWICGGYVDKSMRSHQRLSPEVDHKIPIAQGGDPFDLENLALSHKICNQIKGSKLINEHDVSMLAKHTRVQEDQGILQMSTIDYFDDDEEEGTQ